MIILQGGPELGRLHPAQHHHLSGTIRGLPAVLPGMKTTFVRMDSLSSIFCSGHGRMWGLDLDWGGQWVLPLPLPAVFLRGNNYGVSKFHQERLKEIFNIFIKNHNWIVFRWATGVLILFMKIILILPADSVGHPAVCAAERRSARSPGTIRSLLSQMFSR